MSTGSAEILPAATARIAPVWLLGFGFLQVGVCGAVALLIVPDLLAAARVPEGQIATVTALYIALSAVSIVMTPVLDWRLERRTYAIGLALLTALGLFGALVSIPRILPIAGFLCVVGISSSLCSSAVGGWFGELLPASRKDALGAWFNIGNLGGGGVVGMLGIPVMRALPGVPGALCVVSFVLVAVLIYLVTPCPPADANLSGSSFRRFARSVAGLFRRREVQWVLAMFLAPAASFALTNTLPSFGREFHTSDELVGVLNGVSVSATGILGSLLVPPLTRRVSPVVLYLLVGLLGAAFTLALLPAPRDWMTYGIAVVGEDLFQAAAIASAYVITLRTIGRDNPLAATQFGVLLGAWQLPLAYMQFIDGHAFDFGGVTGSFVTDAVLSGAACVALGLVYWRFAARPVTA